MCAGEEGIIFMYNTLSDIPFMDAVLNTLINMDCNIRNGNTGKGVPVPLHVSNKKRVQSNLLF